MSIANVEQFFEIVQQDESIKQRILAAPDRDTAVQLTVELAAEKGLSFSASELEAVINVYSDVSELSERELATVAGGFNNTETAHNMVASLFSHLGTTTQTKG